VSDEKALRNYVTFGTAEGAPPKSVTDAFSHHASEVAAVVATEVHHAYFMIDHDFADGADSFFAIEGMLVQCAAELMAADAILSRGIALLTIFHHARTIYEAHAVLHWVLQDWKARAPHLVKDVVVERGKFESALQKSGWTAPTNLTPRARALIGNAAVKQLPTIDQMIVGSHTLESDYPIQWKYASAHLHPYAIRSAEVDAQTERFIIEQILRGSIRHACAVYRCVATQYRITEPRALNLLSAAEAWSAG